MTTDGTEYDLFSQRYYAHAYDTFADIRARQPIFRQKNWNGVPTWFVSRYEDAEAVLKNAVFQVREVSDAPSELPYLAEVLGSHMLNRDGESHRRLRALCGHAFTPKRVAEQRPHVRAIVNGLLDGVAARGAMDLIGDFSLHLAARVTANLLGVPDHERFQRWSNASITPVLGENDLRDFAALMGEFIEYMRELFALRRRAPQNDLLSALLAAEQAGDKLSETELLGSVFLLMTAGQETTMSLIGNAFVALAKYPEQLAILKADPSLTPVAVEEFLRFDGSVSQSSPRYLAEDFEFRGHRMRQGDSVIVLLASANHDPAKFADPERLDVKRQPNPHLGFSKGPHTCLGAPLARLEVEIALNELFRRLPDVRLDAPISELRWRPAPAFRSLERLPVAWTPTAA